jgi:hypothetical protein
MAWAEATFGPGRVAAAVSHRDERTPNIHLFVCPRIDSPVKKRGRKPKDGRATETKPCRRLDCAGLIGTDRAALSRLQDSVAAALAPLGLARGQRRSMARHTELSAWRGQQIAAARQEATTLRSTARLTQQVAKGDEREARAWRAGIEAFAAGGIIDAAGPEDHRAPIFAESVDSDRRARLIKEIAAAEQAVLAWIADWAGRLRQMMATAEARAEAVLSVARKLGRAFEVEAARQLGPAGFIPRRQIEAERHPD